MRLQGFLRGGYGTPGILVQGYRVVCMFLGVDHVLDPVLDPVLDSILDSILDPGLDPVLYCGLDNTLENGL